MKIWRTLVLVFLHFPTLQKRRPNCRIVDGTHGARGRGAAPQPPARRPPRCHKPRPGFSTRTSQEPGVRSAVPSWLLGTPAETGRTAGVLRCIPHPRRFAGPTGGPRREGSPKLGLRGQGPRGHQIPRPAHLPTSAVAPDVPPGFACYPTRPARLSARAGHTRSPERPVRRRLLRDWRLE